ncbi:MAG: DUF1177 domain-containing protein [Deltaproteobacteria bacterium]|nr:DUF1177 domain-containing protein [Deltaproteobacteria bacterium]
MVLEEVIEAFHLIDSPSSSGGRVASAIKRRWGGVDVTVETLKGKKGATDFLRVIIPGVKGKIKGGGAPTLGIVGRLGGVGARPKQIGAVSDADGAIVAIASAFKMADMSYKGDLLHGDVIITTHICPKAPIKSHRPAPMMSSPVDMGTALAFEVDDEMDAILSVDTTKGNEVINHTGFAISPTVKEGYILKVSQDLLDVMKGVTGHAPVTFPITTQDITPYGNGISHINSIMQPSTVIDSPVVGVATTAEQIVAGIGTGANYPFALEATTRFCVEVAKSFGMGRCHFYDGEEFARINELYGSMKVLQTPRGQKTQ